MAGGTGIEPAPCGFGACCRSFSSVQGRTRAGLKWPVWMVQSIRTFTSVYRRWGQQCGQIIIPTLALVARIPWSRTVQSHPQGEKYSVTSVHYCSPVLAGIRVG